MRVWLGKETQTKIAEAGVFIPAVQGTAATIKDPFLKAIAEEIGKSQWIGIAIDQLLGPDTYWVFNDVSADIAAGNMTPEAGVEAIEESWAAKQDGLTQARQRDSVAAIDMGRSYAEIARVDPSAGRLMGPLFLRGGVAAAIPNETSNFAKRSQTSVWGAHPSRVSPSPPAATESLPSPLTQMIRCFPFVSVHQVRLRSARTPSATPETGHPGASFWMVSRDPRGPAQTRRPFSSRMT